MLDPAIARAAREAPYLGADEERALLVRAKAGDVAARDILVRSHLRLVIQAASKRKGYGVPIEDLVQDGSAGLVAAIDRFDVDQPVRFATYARWWIGAEMNDAAMRGHSIVRTNTTQANKTLFFGLRRARERLERDGSLTAGEIVDRLAAQFGVETEVIVTMSAWLMQGDKALDAPVGDEDGAGSLVDFLVDDRALPDEVVAESVDGARMQDRLRVALARLADRERDIVVSRRYVDDEAEVTLDVLAAKYGITRERVRQIEVRGLERLRTILTGAPVKGPRGPRPAVAANPESLGEREAIVFKARCGAQGERRTLAALAAQFGLTRERIRQIETALRARLGKSAAIAAE